MQRKQEFFGLGVRRPRPNLAAEEGEKGKEEDVLLVQVGEVGGGAYLADCHQHA